MDLQLVIQETPDRVLSDVEYVHDFVKTSEERASRHHDSEHSSSKWPQRCVHSVLSVCPITSSSGERRERDKNVEQV